MPTAKPKKSVETKQPEKKTSATIETTACDCAMGVCACTTCVCQCTEKECTCVCK